MATFLKMYFILFVFRLAAVSSKESKSHHIATVRVKRGVFKMHFTSVYCFNMKRWKKVNGRSIAKS